MGTAPSSSWTQRFSNTDQSYFIRKFNNTERPLLEKLADRLEVKAAIRKTISAAQQTTELKTNAWVRTDLFIFLFLLKVIGVLEVKAKAGGTYVASL